LVEIQAKCSIQCEKFENVRGMVFYQDFQIFFFKVFSNLTAVKYVRGCVSLKKYVRGCVSLKKYKSQGKAVKVAVNSKEEKS
jgi:hypothetical protein